LDAKESEKYRLKYRALIKQGEIECPEPIRPKKKGKRGRKGVKSSFDFSCVLNSIKNHAQTT